MLAVKVGEMRLSKDITAEARPAKAVIASLYGDYYDKIVRYIFIRINDQSEAENLGGGVFLRALRALDSYRGRRLQMPAWLFSIARNLVVDYLRKVSKRKAVPLEEVEIPNSRLNVEEVVEKKLEVERLSKALKQVTPAQPEVIGLRFFAGLSSAEVGKVLGKSSDAVREMQRAAIKTLRNQMYV
jgi:RNA polymerase sigma-70 factor (ECF subfamily)